MNTKKLYIFNLLVKFLPASRLFDFKARLLRWCGAIVGKNVEIFTPSIQGDFDLVLGDNVFLGHETLIFGNAESKITIENYAKVASRAIVVTGSHKFSPQYPSIAGPGTHNDILIKEGALVDTMAIVLPGKTIGYKSHVAAGAIVTHDVPDLVRVAGIPARIIKDFKSDSDE